MAEKNNGSVFLVISSRTYFHLLEDYMQASLSMMAVTDINTDIGKINTEGEFGWWCESNEIKNFDYIIHQLSMLESKGKGVNAFKL